MAGLVRRNLFGQLFPPSATSQDPEDAVHYFAAVLPGSAAPVIPARWFRDERGDHRPLFISQFFSSCHMLSLARPFMKWLLSITPAATSSTRYAASHHNSGWDTCPPQI